MTRRLDRAMMADLTGSKAMNESAQYSSSNNACERQALARRSAQRRARIVGHVAANWEDAERWDLEFWQRLTPQDRLSALVAIHRDIEAVKRGPDGSKAISPEYWDDGDD